MIATVTLNPALDYGMYFSDFAEGTLNRAQKTNLLFGGKGINVSLILKNLQTESCAFGFAAGFTGKALTENLKEEGIKTDFVFAKQGMTRINVKLKTQGKDNALCETELNAPGPVIGEEEKQELLKKLAILQKGDILVLSGSVPKGLSAMIYAEILHDLKKNGVLAVVDAQGELLQNTLSYHPFLIKPNLEELEEVWGQRIQNRKDLFAAANSLLEKGAQNILVSLGKDGAALFPNQKEGFFLAAPKSNARNTVGAGDSMLAGFLAEYIKTKDKVSALKMAVAAGSATAFSEGLGTKEEIISLKEKMGEPIKIEQIV